MVAGRTVCSHFNPVKWSFSFDQSPCLLLLLEEAPDDAEEEDQTFNEECCKTFLHKVEPIRSGVARYFWQVLTQWPMTWKARQTLRAIGSRIRLRTVFSAIAASMSPNCWALTGQACRKVETCQLPFSKEVDSIHHVYPLSQFDWM